MFNLNKQVQKAKQLQHDKIHGLPDRPKQYNKKVAHVDDMPYDIKAEHEHKYIIRRFINRSKDFGTRLSKRKGEYHRPGGSRTKNPGIVYSLYQEI